MSGYSFGNAYEPDSPLQEVVDALFGPAGDEPDYGAMSPKEYRQALREGPSFSRLEVIGAADTVGLPSELMDVVETLAPGEYTRVRLCINLNTILSARDLTFTYGTVD